MSNKFEPDSGSGQVTAEERSLNRLLYSADDPDTPTTSRNAFRRASKSVLNDADTTTVGTDIGNFFKVLFAFFSGLWNQDFYEFDLLSKVYFPPTEKDESELKKNLRGRVDDMTGMRDDPSKRTLKGLKALTEDLPRGGALSASLVSRMKKDPAIESYVNKTLETVRNYNASVDNYNFKNPNMPPKIKLDEIWMVRQFDQESGFNPQARSSSGAIGIAQFMPSTAKRYGLSAHELTDGNKSIVAGVQHMADLTNKYNNQLFALFAYNGGEGALDYAAQQLTKRGVIKNGQEMTAQQLVSFYEEERSALKTKLASGAITRQFYDSRWAVQTLDYATKHIVPEYKANLSEITGQPIREAELTPLPGAVISLARPAS